MKKAKPKSGPAPTGPRDDYLAALGERVRSLRARKGMTRRALAALSAVSERHLANLELGSGNASVLVLRQIAEALDCPLVEMLGDETTRSPEWLLIRDLLRGRDEEGLRRGRLALAELFGEAGKPAARQRRIALVGLRGAGKSTLGQMLADDLDVPFVELSRAIEGVAGYSIAEIHNLYGATAYRRYERRALEETIQLYQDAVIATPGGIVSDATTFNRLLAHCFTVWLKAGPEDHMRRVEAQGDLRPMDGNQEAMEDLRRILAAREPFYGKADATIDTTSRTLSEAFSEVRGAVRRGLEHGARRTVPGASASKRNGTALPRAR
jgi:XRE family aerobic/anaerobic benzoate catabolism transcriptional regulator